VPGTEPSEDLARHVGNTQAGAEGLLTNADRADRRVLLIRLRGVARTSALRAIVALSPAVIMLTAGVLESRVAAMLAVPALYGVHQAWRAATAFRELRRVLAGEAASTSESP